MDWIAGALGIVFGLSCAPVIIQLIWPNVWKTWTEILTLLVQRVNDKIEELNRR
jgi:hypothetical protein